jgi:hypothetical protein
MLTLQLLCAGVMEGEKFFECNGCLDQWGSTFHYCEACLPVVKAQHAPGHDFASITHEDENRAQVQCLACSAGTDGPVTNLTAMSQYNILTSSSENIANARTHSRAQPSHLTYDLQVGCVEKSARAHKQFRTCPRRGPRNIDVKEEDTYDGETGCQCCWERKSFLPVVRSLKCCSSSILLGFGKDPKTYLCRKCTFTVGACCVESGVANHPHPLIDVWYRRTTPSDDFWQSLIKQDYRMCDGCQGLDRFCSLLMVRLSNTSELH